MGLEEILKQLPDDARRYLEETIPHNFGTEKFTIGDSSNSWNLCRVLESKGLLIVIDRKLHQTTYRLTEEIHDALRNYKLEPTEPPKGSIQPKLHAPVLPENKGEPITASSGLLMKPCYKGAPMPEVYNLENLSSHSGGLDSKVRALSDTFLLQISKASTPDTDLRPYNFTFRAVLFTSIRNYAMPLNNWANFGDAMSTRKLTNAPPHWLLVPKQQITRFSQHYVAKSVVKSVIGEIGGILKNDVDVVLEKQALLWHGYGKFASPVGERSFIYLECAGKIK